MELLRAHDFRVFIVTGGGVEFVRAIGEELYGVAPDDVVGSAGAGDLRAPRRHASCSSARRRCSGSPNEGAPKAVNIQTHIGRRPIFAVGNSAGDREMLEYAHTGPLPSLCLVIDHDDEEREYAYRGVGDGPRRRADPRPPPSASAGRSSACATTGAASSHDGGGGGRRDLDPGGDVPDGLRRPTTPRRRPVREVAVDGFWIDTHAVTNREYAAFVRETRLRHRRRAPARPGRVPGRARRRTSCPGSMVFRRTRGPVDLRQMAHWWAWTPGATLAAPGRPGLDASTRRPSTPSSTSRTRTRGPTREWAGARAADRGAVGARRPRRPRRRDATPGATSPSRAGERLANYWHGDFPWRAEPGYGTTAPVGSFAAQRLRPLRHGRQRLGVDARLVRAALRSRPAGGPRARAGSSRAARSCAPTATARATGPPRGARR